MAPYGQNTTYPGWVDWANWDGSWTNFPQHFTDWDGSPILLYPDAVKDVIKHGHAYPHFHEIVRQRHVQLQQLAPVAPLPAAQYEEVWHTFLEWM